MTFEDWITDPRNWVFVIIVIPMIYSAIRVVTSSNVVHSVLFLVATLAGSAALFLLVGAEFVAWVVVLIYIGSVIVLFLFGIMITRAPLGYDVQLNHNRRWPAVVVSLAVFGLLAFGITAAANEGMPGFGWDEELPRNVTTTADLGNVLFSRYVIPFEVISVLLLAALIGGIVVARRDPDSEEEGLEVEASEEVSA
jgi:NADH-quinone oxidoreductase subunit J